eukprot:CAMPEP_0198256252 /NCGR_PEP_ID=MMETSP1447-20131203/6206_1 /TAXON_ID=420782 /ORGANISM="Chaetoceros dichaeta, Strain CCMP1751" /LENGTH=294 /DNA_ID=CAMNT_0043942843 /DNA_START=17 /DNA_END=901 /DNA_ORIENTATION=-
MKGYNYIYLKCLIGLVLTTITPIASFSPTALRGGREARLIIRTTKSNKKTTPNDNSRLPLPLATSNTNDDNQNNKPPPRMKGKPKPRKTSQFEIQELRAQLSVISKARIPPRNLASEKKIELASYLRTILQTTPSPIPLRSLGDNSALALHGKWRLGFTSSSSEEEGDNDVTTDAALPREAEVYITIKPDYKCDYILSFSKKVFLLSKLIAKSSYIVDCSPVNPGLVTIVYQNIVTDVMGMKGVKVGLFGMLKGRVTYVDTVWFDGDLWVERVFDVNGVEGFNIYVRDDNDRLL